VKNEKRVGLRRRAPTVMAGMISVAVLVAAACQESLTAPGACPDFCPAVEIQVRDSVYLSSIFGDTTFRGYVTAYQGRSLQIVSEGDTAESRAVFRFLPFRDSVGNRPILGVDSFQLNLRLRSAPDSIDPLELVLHRLPPNVDSMVVWDDLAAYFEDSTIAGTYTIPDSVQNDTLHIVFPADGLPEFLAGNDTVSIGVTLRSAVPTFVELGTRDIGQPASLIGYFQVDSSGTAVSATDTRAAAMDTYLTRALPPAGPDVLSVGGLPSARSLLRVTVPEEVATSAGVVRATLILVPSEPAFGAPSDSFRVRAEVMTADVGAKSPILPSTDTAGRGIAWVLQNSTDTVQVDLTPLFRTWQADSTFPRALFLRIIPEGSTVAEMRFWSSRSAVGRPSLRVTYLPPIEGTP